MKFAIVLPVLSLAISALAAVPGDMRSKVVRKDDWESDCTYVSKGRIYDIWNGPGGGDFYRNFRKSPSLPVEQQNRLTMGKLQTRISIGM
jgi:hypothetical protein